MGKAVGDAIASWGSSKKVEVGALVGLSHQIDGECAGFINKAFDQQFRDSLVSNPEWATQFSTLELVKKTGTQGVQLLKRLATRAALSSAGPRVKEVHRNCHIPISNTATGLMAFELA